MAKLPALVRALQKVDGREIKSIEHIARVTRENGYIPTGKRGSGASDMDSTAAANLLIALNSAENPKDVPLSIDRVRSYEVFAPDPVEGRPEVLRHVAEAANFGVALAELIDGVPELVCSFFQMASETYEGDRLKAIMYAILNSGTHAGVAVTIHSASAEIQVFKEANGREIEWSTTFVVNNERYFSGFYGFDESDRRRSVTFGFRTLLAVWHCLHDTEVDNQATIDLLCRDFLAARQADDNADTDPSDGGADG